MSMTGRRRRWRGRRAVGAATAGVLALVPAVLFGSEPSSASPVAAVTNTELAQEDPSTVPPQERNAVLPRGWRSSADLMWTTSGDPTGFHLVVAEARTGYTWRTVATLREPGFDVDRWIGNVCLTGSGERAVVVYAPRQFTNRERLFQRGGFAAVVDIGSGAVTKLRLRASLAYYNPGCGVGETAVLTQSGLSEFGKTRLHLLDTESGEVVRRHELPGQVTSAVPVGDQLVAAGATGLVRIDQAGRQRTLARTVGAPFSIHPDADGGVAFLEAHGDTMTVAKYAADGNVRELAQGTLTKVGLVAGTGGRIFLTGAPANVKVLPAWVRRIGVPAHAEVSTHGVAVVAHRPVLDSAGRQLSPATPVESGTAQPLGLEATLIASNERIDFRVTPGVRVGEETHRGLEPSPAAGPAEERSARDRSGGPSGLSDNPIDTERSCSVSRNDTRAQVYQPHWGQVEWAANLAVQGALGVTRPTNWNNTGLPSWTIQGAGGMFNRHGLLVGGEQTLGRRVPAQIMLGILAQESNMWQASPHALEGVYGNPLIGDFYGIGHSDDPADWIVDWDETDCGYGVAQVTDGMRRDDPSRTSVEQKVIAVDYASNIAAGLRILEEKWNQTSERGLKVNSGNPPWIENWFSAVWAYNTGVQPAGPDFGNDTGCRPGPSCHDGRGNWGLGWSNNPINPEYPANRRPFLNGNNGEGSPNDAAHPQDWPYPEKVMGWAAFPITKGDPFAGTWEPGYAQAWWTSSTWRTLVKPPRTLYCDPQVNSCDPGAANPCLEPDFHCWWNQPVEYKPNCWDANTATITCGQESMSFSAGDPEPPNWNEWYPPNCSRDGLPLGTVYVIDDISHNSPRGCDPPFTNDGTFTLDFAADAAGRYNSKIDFHQIGGGLNGHFWFAHSWKESDYQRFRVTGNWRLNRSLDDTWARVLVHIPDHGSRTQQAKYLIDRGYGEPRRRVINAKSHWTDDEQRHRWVSLGVFRFDGVPEISLSNLTEWGERGHQDRSGVSGEHNVVWDAVAIQPLPRKPNNFVVAMGDSFAAGEGAAEDLSTGADYDRETDMDGDSEHHQNRCHRSRWAWIRQATLKDQPGWMIRGRENTLDNELDFHFVACSGARTQHILPYGEQNAFGIIAQGQHAEVPQLETGFLDENTTLVTLSVGGNDSGWAAVIQHCLRIPEGTNCQDTTLDGDNKPLRDALPERISTKVIPSIQKSLEQIQAQAPNAKIILVGYPRLMEDNSCLSFHVPVWPPGETVEVGINPGEVDWLNAMADYLAGAMNDLTADLRNRGSNKVDAWFSDPRSDFDGHGLCGGNSAIHHAVLTLTPGENPAFDNPWVDLGLSAQSFHPTTEGALLYSFALQRTLALPGVDQ